MGQDQVVFRGKTINIKNKLSLKGKSITSLDEIKGLRECSSLFVLNLSNNNFEEIAGLEQLTNLVELKLSKNAITSIIGLDTLTNLRKLDLSHNDIVEIEGLEHLDNLTTLNLSHNRISRIQGLDSLRRLDHLDLSHNSIYEIEGLDELFSLRSIDLAYNQITKVKGMQIGSSRRWHIEGVRIGTRCNLMGNPLELIPYESPQELRERFSGDPRVRGDGAGIYTPIPQKDYMRMLDGPKPRTRGHVIVHGKKFKCRTKLVLKRRDIMDISDIKGLSQQTQLRHLNLRYNQIREIKGLDSLINLQVLKLASNQIRRIEGLENLIGLVNLDLDRNQIREIEGLHHLVSLEFLFLRWNPLQGDEKRFAKWWIRDKSGIFECMRISREKAGLPMEEGVFALPLRELLKHMDCQLLMRGADQLDSRAFDAREKGALYIAVKLWDDVSRILKLAKREARKNDTSYLPSIEEKVETVNWYLQKTRMEIKEIENASKLARKGARSALLAGCFWLALGSLLTAILSWMTIGTLIINPINGIPWWPLYIFGFGMVIFGIALILASRRD